MYFALSFCVVAAGVGGVGWEGFGGCGGVISFLSVAFSMNENVLDLSFGATLELARRS